MVLGNAVPMLAAESGISVDGGGIRGAAAAASADSTTEHGGAVQSASGPAADLKRERAAHAAERKEHGALRIA